MRRTIPRPADRSEWLRRRLGFFNASDAAALFGEHEFASLGDIAVRKITADTIDRGHPGNQAG